MVMEAGLQCGACEAFGAIAVGPGGQELYDFFGEVLIGSILIVECCGSAGFSLLGIVQAFLSLWTINHFSKAHSSN